jgi:hypothetical protein
MIVKDKDRNAFWYLTEVAVENTVLRQEWKVKFKYGEAVSCSLRLYR